MVAEHVEGADGLPEKSVATHDRDTAIGGHLRLKARGRPFLGWHERQYVRLEDFLKGRGWCVYRERKAYGLHIRGLELCDCWGTVDALVTNDGEVVARNAHEDDARFRHCLNDGRLGGVEHGVVLNIIFFVC